MLDGMRSGAHSFVIKIAFGLIILVFIFWGIGSNTSNSGIVAKVNGEPITINEFQQAYNQMANEIKSVIPDLTEEQLKSFQLENRVLQNVIIRKLFLSEAKRIGLDVSAKELRDTLMALPFFHDESGKFSAELYEQRLKAFGQSSAVFENNLRLDLLPQKFQEVVTAGVFGDKNIAQKMFAFQGERRSMDYVLFPFETDKQNVSDAEAKAVYEERKELFTVPAQVSLEFINFTPALMADENAVTVEEIKAYYDDNQAKFSAEEQVKARHILLMAEPDAPKSENDKILSRLQDIASQIKTVEDFAKMAQQYGQDGTKNSGGDLGWFGKSQMVQEFADVAFALPENTFPIHIPPLRERPGDIPALAEALLAQFSRKLRRPLRMTSEALEVLLGHSWPGNVRELRNVLEFAAYLSPDGAVLPESLPGDLLCTQKGPPLTLAQRVKEFERREALKAVERHGSTTQGKRAAAAELGISLASLYNKLGSS